MSNRTIVEFNHDYTHEIKTDGVAFLKLLAIAMNSGGAEDWKPLERFGVRRAVMAHHSSTRRATVNGTEFRFPGD